MSTFIEDQMETAKEVFKDASVQPSIHTKLKMFALEDRIPELIQQRDSNIKYVKDMSKIPPVDQIPPGIIFVSESLNRAVAPEYLFGDNAPDNDRDMTALMF